MPDILIRDVPPEQVARLDARARAQGISRNALLQRMVDADCDRRGAGQRRDWNWDTFAERIRDLSDPEIMRQAWS